MCYFVTLCKCSYAFVHTFKPCSNVKIHRREEIVFAHKFLIVNKLEVFIMDNKSYISIESYLDLLKESIDELKKDLNELKNSLKEELKESKKTGLPAAMTEMMRYIVFTIVIFTTLKNPDLLVQVLNKLMLPN